jgi:hypothetical protein
MFMPELICDAENCEGVIFFGALASYRQGTFTAESSLADGPWVRFVQRIIDPT